MVILFIFIVAIQYLKIIPEYIDITPFPLEQQQTFNNFHYVFASLINYITTICFLAYFSYGFHKMMAKRLIASKQIQGVLEEEKNSLEIRIKARETELELEKKEIEEKVSQRRRDLEKEGEELEKRVKELGKFQKVAVGREIKIASLEKELDRLKKKNGGKQK
jgi:C4-dicarboxylate-specific signal transduction histidine kinase